MVGIVFNVKINKINENDFVSLASNDYWEFELIFKCSQFINSFIIIIQIFIYKNFTKLSIW